MDQSQLSTAPLAPELLRKMNAYWQAANYLLSSDVGLLEQSTVQSGKLPRSE